MFASKASRVALGAALACVALVGAVGAVKQVRQRVAPDPALEGRLEVRASTVPGAGLGAFARGPIRRGDVVATFSGVLAFVSDDADDTYRVRLAPCARAAAWPWDALDATAGGLASRVNFAPATLNGTPTGLQNVRGEPLCEKPFVRYVATRDIQAGEELFTSYGPGYDYGFMALPGVRGHFCRVTGSDCNTRYDWTP